MTSTDPFEDLRRALSGLADQEEVNGVRVDLARRVRTGAPEVVYGPGKSVDQIVTAVRALVAANGRALVARVDRSQVERIQAELADEGIETCHDSIGNTLVARINGSEPESNGGRVGILTAGSSDRPQACEAAAVLNEMGTFSLIRCDVGVAGLHRLVNPLQDILSFDPDALIVAAGMDGVLPSVVSGLVAIPTVALPTSTGYGFGGHGIGALTTMLQTCSPGIAVVNIDNGIGAGVMAGLIANRAARYRSAGS